MREILFRGKNPVNGEWFYGSIILEKNAFDERLILAIISDADANETLVNPETVGQSTGMYDQDGNEIFEGDIVRVANMFIGKIAFAAGAFGVYTGYNLNQPIDYDYLASEIAPITGCNNRPHFCYEDYFVSLYELYFNFNGEENCCPGIEVIGNIYDNPELLEESK